MNNSSPFSLSDAAPELAQRLALILAGLAALVARRFLRMPHLVGLTVLLCGRLSRAMRRFGRALTHPGKVRPPRARVARVKHERTKQAGLPSGRGWLVRELGWEAVGYSSQLQALLSEPATQAVLASLPGAARILRPLCRMLGVPASVVPPPVVVAPAAEAVAEKARPPSMPKPARQLTATVELAAPDAPKHITPMSGLSFSSA